MTDTPPKPSAPILLEPIPVERSETQAISQEIPEVLDWLSTIQAADVEGVEPFDVTKALRPAASPKE